MKVIKRNGDEVDFCKEKIVSAISRANDEVGSITEENKISKEVIATIANRLYERCRKRTRNTSVEEIQDMVETELMKEEAFEVAKAYIRYRYKKSIARDKYQEMMDAVAEKIRAKNVVNQNANVDEKSFGGRIGEMSNMIMKQYALDYCMSDMAKNNHLNNEIYIHDLDHYAVGDHNCLSIPFDDLLAKGFNTRQTDVRPAGSLSTAFQLVAVIFQIQSLQQFGGVSATHLDWTMVPYVRKSFFKHFRDGLTFILKKSWAKELKKNDDYSNQNPIDWEGYKKYPEAYEYALQMTQKECHQAVEGLYHNLNTLQSRSGCQLPFTSINYGTCTLPEGRMVTREILDVSIEGTGRMHKTSIFPCGIFQCMKGVNRKPGDPNYDLFKLALKSTSLRLYPNYANVDWTGNAGYDRNDPRTYFSTMGCRTVNGADINVNEGVNPQLKDGRGNICPVTIILPTIAMEAKEAFNNEHDDNVVDVFMEMLDKKIAEARDMLIERFDWICSQPAEAASFMYENGTMAGYVPEEGIRSALKHGTLVIGQLGLAEALNALIGCNHTTPKGMELAKKIEQLFKDRCAEFKKKYSLNFGVYYTPAENLCYTAMQKFKSKYGVISNVSDREFFTNSIHVPVWEHLDPIEKINIEAQLTGYSNAGCITYVELDSSAKHNTEALEDIVNYAMDADVPYLAINIPNDMCQTCGYTDEINEKCPICGGTNIRRLRRVTGYLTGDYKTAFNYGKQKEVEARFKHTMKTLGE